MIDQLARRPVRVEEIRVSASSRRRLLKVDLPVEMPPVIPITVQRFDINLSYMVVATPCRRKCPRALAAKQIPRASHSYYRTTGGEGAATLLRRGRRSYFLYIGTCGNTGGSIWLTVSVSSSSSCMLTRLAAWIDQAGGDEDDEVALDVLVDVGPEKRPTSGMSPMIGVRSSVFCTSSRIKPPSTTVWPSHTLTLVVTLRVLKIGWLMTFGVMTFAVS